MILKWCTFKTLTDTNIMLCSRLTHPDEIPHTMVDREDAMRADRFYGGWAGMMGLVEVTEFLHDLEQDPTTGGLFKLYNPNDESAFDIELMDRFDDWVAARQDIHSTTQTLPVGKTYV